MRQTAALRSLAEAEGWPIERTVAAIVAQFGVSPLKAYRLARGWTRPQVVAAILALYVADELAPPGLTTDRLCHWEHGRAPQRGVPGLPVPALPDEG